MARMISVGKSPKIIADSISGDVSVVGWEGSEILVKADDEEIRLEQNGDEIRFSCDDDISLRVPKASVLNFISIAGDAAIRGVSGDIQITEINGDLSMREVGSVSIDSIQADLSLRGASGNLYVKSAKSDISIRDVDGNINIDSVADDLALRGAHGNIKVNVGEDVVIYLEPGPDAECSVVAGDDILLVLPATANATLDLHGDRIDIDWPGIENEEDVIERNVVLGDGSARITLNAGGDIRVTNDANAGDSAEEFGNFAGLNFDWSGFGERISRQVEQATARAAKRAEEAARRAERHAERQARRWKGNVKVGRWNWDLNQPGVPKPPTPPSEPVADEERMTILKMLQDKKITSEQAEQLLQALEGGK
jgi:hypothetical protein